VFTNGVGSATTQAVTLTVDFVTITQNPSNATVVAGTTASFMAAASANPSDATVQWQVNKNDGNGFTNISGATSSTLTFTADASENGYEYQVVFTNSASISATTTAATLTVDFAPMISTQPSNQTIAAGQLVSFTAAASANPTATVQWQVNKNDGNGFSDISGATSTTLTFATDASENGYEYQAVFTNGVGSATTQAVTLTVDFVTITQNPSNATVAAGAAVSFVAAASANPSDATVQWQVNKNDGNGFTNISGATSSTLTFTADASENGYEYQAVFTNSASISATTTAATLTVDFVTITTNPSNTTVGAGTTASFMAAASANPSDATVQWQVNKNDGNGFINISGATSSTLTFTADASENGYEYQAVFTNSASISATTTAATLTVTAAIPPSITQQPSATTVNAGQTATFMATASGTPAPTVQWQVSVNGGAFTDIPGATSTTLSVTATASDNGNRYQAVFTNSAGSATSSAATLTVDFAPTVISSPSSVIGASGQVATFTAGATGNPLAVQWQVSVNGGSFNDIPGATSTTLSVTISAGENGNVYQAVFSNSLGMVSTTPATLTVIQATTPVFRSANHVTFVAGMSTPASFTIMTTGSPSAALSLVGKLPTGVTFHDNGNGTATLTNMAAIGTGGTYHLTLLAFNGKSASQAFTLTIYQAPVITAQPIAQTVAAGSIALFTASVSALPVAAVQWQVLTPGAVLWKNVAGATSTTLRVTASLANNGYQYRAVFTNVINGVHNTTTSNAATLTVYKAPAITSANHVTFKRGTPSSFTISTLASPAATLSVIGGLPNGLTLTISTISGVPTGIATISGTPGPDTAGTYTLIIVADNPLGDAIQTFTLTIR
jgi:hypothetical protein